MIRLPGALLFALSLALAQSPDNPLNTLPKEHPRLILLDTDLERIRALIRTDPMAGDMYRALASEADNLETAPTVEYKLIGPRLLSQSRRCLDRIYTLALLYRLDGKRQHLERAVRELRAAADFPNWNPSHFLDTAEMTHAFAIGYDWLYNSLPAGDRAWIRRALVEKGLDQALPIYRARRAWTVNRFNWNQVCNGGISIGALAVAEDEPEKSGEVLRSALKSIPIAMASYAPDGGWPEGPGYWHYATRYNVYFLAALESALGSDFGLSGMKGFDRAGRFRVYFCGPSGKTFNYADAGDGIGGAAEMFWLARKFSEPVYAWHQREQLKARMRPEALDLIWYRPGGGSPAEAGWPLDAVFGGVEVAFLRSSWDDPDSIFIGAKAGDTKVGHSQLDLGTFVLDAGGQRWAIDLGPDDYNMPAYFGKQRWTYYRLRTESHNTILLDSENQDPKGEARITAQRFGRDLSLVRMDLANAYPSKVRRFERGIALIGRRHALVQDELAAPNPVEALWGMVTGAEVRVNGRTAVLEQAGRSLTARILSPQNAVFEVVSTRQEPPQNPNAGTRKLVVKLPARVAELRLAVALTPHRTGEPAPKLAWKDRPLGEW